jgi:hypothetical protein
LGNGVAAHLESEVACSNERLRISFYALVADDITGAREIEVFADIGRSDDGVVYLAFNPEIVGEAKVSVEGHTLNVLLGKVGVGKKPTGSYLN